MLAALLLNVSSAATAGGIDVFASPGDYRLDVFRKRRKRKPSEVVDDAIAAFPEAAGALLAPFLVEGAGQALSSLVDFRRLLADMVAYGQLLAMLERHEEEEMAMILAMVD